MTTDPAATAVACGIIVLIGWRLVKLRGGSPLTKSFSQSVRDAMCLDDIELLGKAKLPAHVAKYYSYTSGAGHTFSTLSRAYDSVKIITKVLAGVSGEQVDTRVTVFGTEMSSPIMIAPTAFHKLAHDEGEVATARAAAAVGVNLVYSFMLSNTLADEVCAKSVGGPKWAHLYILKDREYVLHTVREAERLGFTALVVTCDHPHEGVKRHTLPGKCSRLL
jgi:isopentenyl diphosphate isomerase/L-lactate dehydrogenase-like FMN-dependent dehydrogenase